MELRFGEVEIRRPRDEQDHSLAATVRLRLVDVREVEPPEGAEPLHWRLVTTHEIADTAKAWQVVAWYQARWIIEQLFRVMKSQGLQLEDSQLASGERLVKLAAAATKAACIDMQLVQERDGKDQLPASVIFTEPEIETLEALSPTLKARPSGRTTSTRKPRPRFREGRLWAAWIKRLQLPRELKDFQKRLRNALNEPVIKTVRNEFAFHYPKVLDLPSFPVGDGDALILIPMVREADSVVSHIPTLVLIEPLCNLKPAPTWQKSTQEVWRDIMEAALLYCQFVNGLQACLISDCFPGIQPSSLWPLENVPAEAGNSLRYFTQ